MKFNNIISSSKQELLLNELILSHLIAPLAKAIHIKYLKMIVYIHYILANLDM